MMKAYWILITILLMFARFSFAQEIIAPSTINWYSLTQALELAKEKPRPIMLDVYTDWCSWCKFMMKTTFANKGIADYINNNFYAAKFNAETFDTIIYKGQKYFNRRIGSKPSHDLAAMILDSKLSYPSIVFFDIEGNKTVVPGYKEAKDIEPFLIYFAENVNKTASLDDFYINFMYSFPDAYKKDHSIFKIDNSLKPDTLGKIDWIAPDKLANVQKKKPKPYMMFFYTDWNISSKVIERAVFRDRELTNKINLNYYALKINAASNDTIEFLGKIYSGTGNNQPNQLAYTFLNNNFQMPAVVIFDEKNNIIGLIHGFWAKNQLIPLLQFISDGSYKNITFQEYLKTYKKS